MRKSLAVILILLVYVSMFGQTNIRANNGVFKNLQGIPHCKDFATPGITSFDAMMTACVAALGTAGSGTVNAMDVTDTTNLTMTANWTISRSGTTILFPCGQINQATFGVIVPSPTSNVTYKGCAPYATTPSGLVNGTYFLYTGTGTAHSFGDSSATSFGHVVEDVGCQLTSTAGAHCFDSTRVYGAEFNRNRGLCPVGANTDVFLQNNGTSTPIGGQSMVRRSNVENNCQFGFSDVGGSVLTNGTVDIENQFSGNTLSGGIAVDEETGNGHIIINDYIGNYDTGLKVATASGNAVWGQIHMESCGTQGILFTAAAVNNEIWTDTSCAITDTGGIANQNSVHDATYSGGSVNVYGGFRVLGTTNPTDLFGAVQSRGFGGLPAATAGTLWFAGGIGPPVLGAGFCGDGTGWELDFDKRTASVNTVLWKCKDNGGLYGVERAAPSAEVGSDVIYPDSTLHCLKGSWNNGAFFCIAQVISATSAAFATATTAGTCVQNTTSVTGATTSMMVNVSPASTPGVGAQWSAFVSSAGNVTINECAVATSAGGTIAFNIRVTP